MQWMSSSCKNHWDSDLHMTIIWPTPTNPYLTLTPPLPTLGKEIQLKKSFMDGGWINYKHWKTSSELTRVERWHWVGAGLCYWIGTEVTLSLTIIFWQELASEIWINYVAPKLPPDDPLRVIQNNFKNALNIIRTFGRFPHRNDLLGRTNTDNEVMWFKVV